MKSPAELLRDRIVVLDGVISDDTANMVIAQLLFLEAEQPGSPIHIYLRSPGGHVSSTLAIRDTMDALSCPVHVRTTGSVGGVALLILAHGARGHRTAIPHTTLTLSAIRSSDLSSSAVTAGNHAAADAAVVKMRKPFLAAELERTESTVVDLLAADTGQRRETVLADMRADRAFTVDEAVAYGLVDRR